MKEKIIKLIEDVLKVPAGTITEDTMIEDVFQFLTLLHNVTRRSVLQKVRDRALLALSLLVNTGFQVR